MKLSNEILRGLAMAGLAIAGTENLTSLRNIIYFDQYVSFVSSSMVIG